MQLVVRQNGGNANRLRFTTGPVHLGRGVESQVFLPAEKVSRHHAVIFTTPEGDWILQDLDSANKTPRFGRRRRQTRRSGRYVDSGAAQAPGNNKRPQCRPRTRHKNTCAKGKGFPRSHRGNLQDERPGPGSEDPFEDYVQAVRCFALLVCPEE